MNVPLYAVALTSFSLAYLEFGLLLSTALAITLSLMAAVLALQIVIERRELTRSHAQPPTDTVRLERQKWAREWTARDSAIDIAFVGITWVIFTSLGNPDQIGGAGWAHPISGPATAVNLLAVGLVLAPVVAIALLWHRYRDGRVDVLLKRLADSYALAMEAGAVVPPSGAEPVAQAPTGCQAEEATSFAFAVRPVPRRFWTPPHDTDLRLIGLTGARLPTNSILPDLQGPHRPPGRFLLCSRHVEQLLIAEVLSRAGLFPQRGTA